MKIASNHCLQENADQGIVEDNDDSDVSCHFLFPVCLDGADSVHVGCWIVFGTGSPSGLRLPGYKRLAPL